MLLFSGGFVMRLKELRLASRMTQADCAAILDTTPQTYSRYELEQNEIPLASMRRLASHYGVTIDYLVGYSDIPNVYKHPQGTTTEPPELLETKNDRPSVDERSRIADAIQSGKAIRIRKPKDLPKDRKEFEQAVLDLIRRELGKSETEPE
jgi:transcriptional regulator with XRE-family HTH domain